MAKVKTKFVGKWAFLIGLIVAILASFLGGYEATIAVVLFILGLVVGLLNITEKDSNKFLLGTIALLTGGIASLSAVSMLGMVATYLVLAIGNFVAFVSAAALVVAIKAIFETGKN